MTILGLDIGSSSVKAGRLRGGRVVGEMTRADVSTRYDGERAEVDAEALFRAVSRAAQQLEDRRVDAVAISTMSPSWLATDAKGRALTPIVTHQDRRSVEIARQIERDVGKARHLKLAGNRPFPGGISSTTCAWFLRHERGTMRRAALVGHVNSFLHQRLTGARVTDPSHASFMGVYETLKLGGWSEELCRAIGLSPNLLPEIRESDEVAAHLTAEGARALGVPSGTPVLAGLTDTGAAMLRAGARPGQLLDVCGSTDVLALCTDRPRPHERLLTRALGVGRLWLSVATLAAAGSAIEWARKALFAELEWQQFERILRRIERRGGRTDVRFDPCLAGDRTSIEQRRGAFHHLRLDTTREDMLAAVIEALAQSSAERLKLLMSGPVKPRRDVLVSGGTGKLLQRILHRDWRGQWRHRYEPEATLRGLWKLAADC